MVRWQTAPHAGEEQLWILSLFRHFLAPHFWCNILWENDCAFVVLHTLLLMQGLFYTLYENISMVSCVDNVSRKLVMLQSYGLSGAPRRGGLKQQWHTELRSSVWELQNHSGTHGNAIQALERSIVRITLLAEKEISTVLSQIASRLFLSFSYYQNWVQTLTPFQQNKGFSFEV